MSGLYSWVGSIAFYLIFITVVVNLLPNKKYEKYIKLFSGMVFILLVLKPLTGGLRLEDKIAYYFESFTFQNDADDLKKELTGMEQYRMEQMIGQYEDAVAKDVEAMAADLEFYPVRTEVKIESDPGQEAYGTVTHIKMTVTRDQTEETAQDRKGAGSGITPVEPMAPVEPVKVGEETKEQIDLPVPDEGLNRLRRKVEGYYGLQTADVEIELEKR